VLSLVTAKTLSEVESAHEHKLLPLLSRKEIMQTFKLRLFFNITLEFQYDHTQLQVNKFLYYHLNQDVYVINLLQGIIFVGKCYASTLS
jgi:hypothetical protein